METVIATREFYLRDEAVVLMVYAPVAFGDEGDFRCTYKLDLPPRTLQGSGFGVDAIQAIEMALQHCHISMLALPEWKSGELTWLVDADLGLPLPSGMKASDFRK